MVSVTISGSAEDVLKEMERICHPQGGGNSQVYVPAKIEKEKASKPASVAPPVPTTLAPETASAVHLTPTGAITLADIQTDIPKLAAKMGKDKTVEMLGRYGAKKGSEIKPDDFEKFHAEAKTLLA